MATDNEGGYMPVADVDNALPIGTKNYLRVKILNKDDPANSMPAAPLDGPYLAQGGTWSKLSASSAATYYRWSTDTVTPPSAGFMSANNADMALITEIYVSINTSTLVDITYMLKKMGKDNTVFITQDMSDTAYGGYVVSSDVVDNLLYFTIPVELGSAGATPSDGETVVFDVHSFRDEQVNPTFSVLTRDRIPSVGGISEIAATPTYLTGLEISEQTGGFELVTTGPWANTGAVLNNTGFDIDVIGTFSYYPDNSGGTSRIDMWSETSTDGIAITENEDSARSIEIASNGESSGTKSSRFTNWKNGDMVRFAFTDTGGGDCSFTSLSVTSTQGTVSAPSFSFQEATARKVNGS